MASYELLIVCCTAFIAVFVLLSLMAVVMRLLVKLFPAKDAGHDAALVAAVAVTFKSQYPGARITRMEEVI